ncbi:MAG: hypothetical protein PHC64_03005 [Candidatus Gastranaerophilales bacterium]|nr:hypothetical protein [Candidatus Gastranaerophilales bacterium]
MREVKNENFGKIPNAHLKRGKTNEKSSPPFCAKTETECISDFSNPKEVLGRSQVSKSDNRKADVAFGMANPEAIAKADNFFEIAYANLQAEGDPNAYEKAAAMSTIYAKELT